MKSYSVDLRRKLLEAWQKGNRTQAELADLFGVGPATVGRWIRLYRETGDVDPRPYGGGRARIITEEQLLVVENLVLKHPDWTEEEYTSHLQEEHGITASRSTVGRAIRRLGYSVKKRPSRPRSEIVQMSSSDGTTTSKKSQASPLRVWYSWTKRAPTSR